MNRLSLVMTTGILLTGHSASASDILLIGEPFNKLTTCAWVGPGYFKLPGFDTCLKLGGRLRGDIKSDNLTKDNSTGLTDYQSYIESRLNFETKSQIGPFRISTFSGMEYQWEPEDRTTEITAQKALISFESDYANISAGIDKSLYTGFTGYSGLNLGGEQWSDTKPLQAALKIPVGNMVFGFGIEDIAYEDVGSSRNGRPQIITTQDYGLVSSFEYFSEFWDVKLSGIASDVSKTQVNLRLEEGMSTKANFTNGYGSNYNYAVNINTEIRPHEFFNFSIGAQIGSGALGYTGLDFDNYEFPDFTQSLYGLNPVFQALMNPIEKDNANTIQSALFNYAGGKSYTLMGGFNVELVQNVFMTFDATYQYFQLDESIFDITGSGYSAATSLIWKPTRELGISFGGGISSFETQGTIYTGAEDFDIASVTDNLQVGTRIEYVFDPTF